MKTAALILALFLGGCVATKPTTITIEKQVVVDVPAHFFKCEGVKFPDYATLTDAQVARLLVDLQGRNRECRRNIQAIKDFLADAKAQIQK